MALAAIGSNRTAPSVKWIPTPVHQGKKHPPYWTPAPSTVIVRVDVDTYGLASSPRLQQRPNKDLSWSALEAASHSAFEPGTEDGKPVDWKDVDIEVRFGPKIKEVKVPHSGPGKFASVMTAVAQLSTQAILMHDCPILYRTPILLLRAGDLQYIQTCNANGFMVFGVYVYTGVQPR